MEAAVEMQEHLPVFYRKEMIKKLFSPIPLWFPDSPIVLEWYKLVISNDAILDQHYDFVLQ
jgi:hypothetical protein